MGTNYYWTKESNKCEHCGRSDVEELHIGKSSGGWCFSLHVDPERGIHDLPDWERVWRSGGSIRNEYGDTISIEKMRRIITARTGKPWDMHAWTGYRDEAHFHESNYSQRGPYGLLRHIADSRRCIKHGDGTWDCIVGEFS